MHIGERKIIIFFLLIMVSIATAFSQNKSNLPTAEIEAGGFINIKANSANAHTYQWFKNGDIIAGATQTTLRVTEPGIYTVLALNIANCTSVMSDGVQILLKLEAPQANLQVTKKSELRVTGISDPYEYLITVTNKGPKDANKIVVKDKLPESLILKDMVIPSTGTYDYDAKTKTITWKIEALLLSQTEELRFKVESLNPGLVRNTAIVTSDEQDPYPADNQATDDKEIAGLKVPNVFTPNGDNVNDRFEIRNLDLYQENDLTIINRWGNTVYQKKNYSNDWSGYGLDEGTYFYILKVKSTTGAWHTYKGYTTILRTASQ